MMSIADNRCALCRGEAVTSTTQSQCPASPRCINCVVPTASTLCTRCETLPRCGICKRHLRRCCFLQFDGDNVSDSSEATDKKPAAVCQLQSIISKFCGHYCIYFCIRRSSGIDVRKIVCSFTSDTGLNDVLVHAYVCSRQ